MTWDFRNDLPIYSQLIEQIKLAIVSGVFAPGMRLNSVRDMAAEAGVNPNTLQRALQELERQGLVFSQRTSGRYVTEDTNVIDETKRALAQGQLAAFLDAMKKLGYERAEIIALLKEEA
ncbi:MAG: GntR family transcriptional regulator [Eubacteriales bacterium]|nr:GntR family transcriptional regulator [Eubacteriales bacterium]